MKFARHSGGRTAMIVGQDCGGVLDLASNLHLLDDEDERAIARVLPGAADGSWSPMIERWSEVRPAFERFVAIGEAEGSAAELQPIAAVSLEAPIPCRERRIFSLGANTIEHTLAVFAARAPETPITADDLYKSKRADISPAGFNVLVDSVIGPDATVTPPAFLEKLDYEAECAAIVGSAGRDQGQGTVIWGYTAWNDFSLRDGHLGLIPTLPPLAYSLNVWKNWDGANACGPWVVVDEGYDLDNLRCQLFVNGEQRQDWNTADMIYSFADLFDHMSRYMALKPGDMGTSGTGKGSALEGPVESDLWLSPGDVVEVRLDGVGVLLNTIGPS